MSEGKSVLIVDDSSYMQAQLRKILEQAGFNIIGTGSNGMEAIKLYRELKPDLITLDIIMPQMGGIEALRMLKSIDPKVNAVMVSSITDKESIKTCAAIGARNYILKPFDEQKVLEVVRRVLL